MLPTKQLKLGAAHLMPEHKNNAFFSYPLRGLSILLIFICVGPPVQAIIAIFLAHNWHGSTDVFNAFLSLLIDRAFPSIVPAYSTFLPAPLLAGLWAGGYASRGLALTISGAIGRTIVMAVFAEMLIMAVVYLQGVSLSSEFILTDFFSAGIQGIGVGWISWIICTIFKFDKPVAQNIS